MSGVPISHHLGAPRGPFEPRTWQLHRNNPNKCFLLATTFRWIPHSIAFELKSGPPPTPNLILRKSFNEPDKRFLSAETFRWIPHKNIVLQGGPTFEKELNLNLLQLITDLRRSRHSKFSHHRPNNNNNHSSRSSSMFLHSKYPTLSQLMFHNTNRRPQVRLCILESNSKAIWRVRSCYAPFLYK